MTDFSPEFRAALEIVVRRLGEDLSRPPYRLFLDVDAGRVGVRDGVLHVPVRHEVHWRRFRTVPTELVRDAAFAASRAGGADEADAQAFAERFLRVRWLEAD